MTPNAAAPPPRILLTGAGSLVGRCVLDSLQGRRGSLVLVGGDLDPEGVTVRECDSVVPLPATEDPGFRSAVEAVCLEQEIDLVVPCRDPDALALAAANDDSDSPVRVPGAPLELVQMTRDKWRTYEWCMSRGIPFAPSLSTDDSTDEEFREFTAMWGFPLIAKPRSGSGSVGVRILAEQDHLNVARAAAGYVVQPFLDPPDPSVLALDLSSGIPLFWEVPVVSTPAITLVVGPDGSSMEPLCFFADQRLGRVEAIQRASDPALIDFANSLNTAFRSAGWLGPLSVPLRRGPDGWFIIELNPRFSGGTSSRLQLGFDEVRWVLNRWLDREVVPAWTGRPVDRVVRLLRDIPDR